MDLKLDVGGLNAYERQQKTLSKRAAYDKSMWDYALGQGSIDAYSAALSKIDDTAYSKMYSDLGLESTDMSTKLTALYNEVAGDKTTLKKRERTRYNDDGTVMTDEAGKPIVDTYEATDYDYTRNLIKERSNYNKLIAAKEVEDRAKEQVNFFAKLGTVIGDPVNRLGTGAMSAFDSLQQFLTGAGAAIVTLVKPQGVTYGDTNKWDEAGKAFIEYGSKSGMFETLMGMFYDKYGSAEQKEMFDEYGLLAAAKEVDARYSPFYNTDGSPKFKLYDEVMSAMFSIGQMLPSAMIGNVAGSTVTAFGGSIKAASTVSKILSSGTFYAGMTRDNIREMYNETGCSVEAGKIIANAAIKSAAQYGVEVLLDKFLGASALDQMLFKREGRVVTSNKGLTESAISTLTRDFFREGTEEVLQDWSDFFVNEAFTYLVDENFGQFTNKPTIESMIDTFFVGGLMSLMGSGFQIATTENHLQLTYDEKGISGAKKYSKLASWEYNNRLSTFMDNFNKAAEYIQKYSGKDNLTDAQKSNLADLVATVDYAYNAMFDFYKTVGQDRFMNAVKINERLIDYKQNIKDKSDVDALAAHVNSLFDTVTAAEAFNSTLAKQEFERLKMTKVKKTINRDDIKNMPTTDPEREIIEELMKGDSTLDNVVTTEDGSGVTRFGNVMVIADSFLRNADGTAIFEAEAENRAIESLKTTFNEWIAAGTDKTIDTLVANYQKYSGNTDATVEDTILALIADKEFFRESLFEANINTVAMLTTLKRIADSVIPNDLRDKIYKNRLGKCIADMRSAIVSYLKVVDIADISLLPNASNAEIDAIKKSRTNRDAMNAVLLKGEKLDGGQLTHIYSMINNTIELTVDEKTKLKENLKSDDVNVRKAAMKQVANLYYQTYYAGYDGVHRLLNTSIANRVFNNFMDKMGFESIASMMDESKLTDADKKVMESNKWSLLKYRQQQFLNNNKTFTFTIDSNNNVVLYSTSTGIAVDTTVYSKIVDNDYTAKNAVLPDGTVITPEERTLIYDSYDKHNLLADVLNKDLALGKRFAININDVISNPALLNEEITNGITLKYKRVTPFTTYAYLHDYFIEKTGTTTLVTGNDGSVHFGDYAQVKEILKPNFETMKLTQTTRISDVVDSKYLVGGVENVTIEVTNDKNVTAEYIPLNYKNGIPTMNNVIRINPANLKKKGINRTIAFSHELEHAMAFNNALTLGFNSNAISSFGKDLVTDLRKHYPKMFEGVDKDSPEERNIAGSIIYMHSGESIARGINDTSHVAFLNIAISVDEKGTHITMPWGKTYNSTDDVTEQEAKLRISTTIMEMADKDKVTTITDKGVTTYDGETIQEKQVDKSIKESFAAPVNDFVKRFVGSLDFAKDNTKVRLAIKNNLTPEIQSTMLHLAYEESGSTLNYDEWLESDITVSMVMRKEIAYPLNDCTNVIIGGASDAVSKLVLGEIKRKDKFIVRHGKIKAKELIAYTGDGYGFVNSDTFAKLPSRIGNMYTGLTTASKFDIIDRETMDKYREWTYSYSRSYDEIADELDSQYGTAEVLENINSPYNMFRDNQATRPASYLELEYCVREKIINSALLYENLRVIAQSVDEDSINKIINLIGNKSFTFENAIELLLPYLNKALQLEGVKSDNSAILALRQNDIQVIDGFEYLLSDSTLDKGTEYGRNPKPQIYLPVKEEGSQQISYDDVLKVANDRKDTDPYVYELLRKLLPVAKGLGISIYENKNLTSDYTEGANYAGTVWIDLDAAMSTLLHEVIHALTTFSFAINASKESKQFAKDFIKDFVDMYISESSLLTDDFEPELFYDVDYKDKNPYEFLAEVGSRKEYRQAFAKTISKLQNLFDRIIESKQLRDEIKRFYVSANVTRRAFPSGLDESSSGYELSNTSTYRKNVTDMNGDTHEYLIIYDTKKLKVVYNYGAYEVVRSKDSREAVPNTTIGVDEYMEFWPLNKTDISSQFNPEEFRYAIKKMGENNLIDPEIVPADEGKHWEYDKKNVGDKVQYIVVDKDGNQLFNKDGTPLYRYKEPPKGFIRNNDENSDVLYYVDPDEVKIAKYGWFQGAVGKDAKYLKRYICIRKNGEQITKILKGARVPVYKYVYKAENRLIAEKDVESGSYLENFKGDGRLELNKNVAGFVRDVDKYGIKSIDKELRPYIEKGTLTLSVITDYLRTTDNMGDETFMLIKKHFYPNSPIASFEELQTLVINAKVFYAYRALYRISKDKPELNVVLNQKFGDQPIHVVIERLGRLLKSEKGRALEQIMTRYNEREADEKYLRISFMNTFDGTLESAGHAAAKASMVSRLNYDVTGTLKTGTTDKSVGGEKNKDDGARELTGEDVIADNYNPDGDDDATGGGGASYTDAGYSFIGDDVDYREKIDYIYQTLFQPIAVYYASQGMDYVEAVNKIKWFKDLLEGDVDASKLRRDTNKQLNKRDIKSIYDSMIENSDLDAGDLLQKIDDLYALGIYAESTGNAIDSPEAIEILDKANEVVETTDAGKTRNGAVIVENIKSTARRIRTLAKHNNLTATMKKKIAIASGGILDDNLEVVDDAIKTQRQRSEKEWKRIVYKSVSELVAVEDMLKKIVKDINGGIFANPATYNQMEKLKKENARLASKLEKANAELILDKTLGKKTREVKQEEDMESHAATYKIGNLKLVVEENYDMPSTLKQLLEFNVRKKRSEVQLWANEDSEYVATEISKFMYDNAEFLTSLDKKQVNELVDYLLNTHVPIDTDSGRIFANFKHAILAYLAKGSTYTENMLDDVTKANINGYLTMLSSQYGQGLSNVRAILNALKPEEQIISKFAKINKIEFDPALEGELYTAILNRDAKAIEIAKKKMYDDAVMKAKGNKQSIWIRLQRFESAMMLSSPTTWLRNYFGNIGVTLGNKLTDAIISSKAVSKLLTKVTNKYAPDLGFQYKIIGTKIDTQYKDFINTWLVETGLSKNIMSGLTKYDPAKAIRKNMSIADNIVAIVGDSIINEAFRDNPIAKDGNYAKVMNAMYRGIFKMLSDDKSIEKAAFSYLGKMMTEYYSEYTDKKTGQKIRKPVDISKGLRSHTILTMIGQAYTMAAQDYMHKTNIFTQFEKKLDYGSAGWWAWKQIMPFAGASWNWFVEGIRYSPIGLASAIKDLVKLENYANKLATADIYNEGKPSPEFASYLVSRNIGKGVIGTVTFIIGALLAALGVVGIDEKDDKYKLKLGDVYVDMSDAFGMSGLYIGITAIRSLIDNADSDSSFIDVVTDTFKATADAFFTGSVFEDLYTTFRYSTGTGDIITNLASDTLSKFWPNFLKVLASEINVREMKYSSTLSGQINKRLAQWLPGYAYLLDSAIDPYTGEAKYKYDITGFTDAVDTLVLNVFNKHSQISIKRYAMSDLEREAQTYGVKRGQLTCIYEVDGKKVTFSADERAEINRFYGSLNNKTITALMSNKASYSVLNANGKYVNLKYSAMSDKQKKEAIEAIMNSNANIAKAYGLTSKGYKYYAGDTMFAKLRAAGVTKNVFHKTGTKEGFVK